MNTVVRHMTVDAFLDWTPDQDARWELVHGWRVRMQAEGIMHMRVKGNVFFAIRQSLPAHGPCEIFPDGGAVRIDESTAYIPDAVIDCSVPPGADTKEHRAPVAIFEVAVTSEARDMGEKRAAYFTRETLEHYVVVIPERRTVYHWRRGTLDPTELTGEDVLSLDPPGVSVPVAGFFDRF